MNNLIKMYSKTQNSIVDVYKINENGTAVIFSSNLAAKQNGNGWNIVKLKYLIPLEYYNEHSNGFISKTKRNQIKERLTLTSAVWTCTDGTSFTDCNKAIIYEQELMDKEAETHAE